MNQNWNPISSDESKLKPKFGWMSNHLKQHPSQLPAIPISTKLSNFWELFKKDVFKIVRWNKTFSKLFYQTKYFQIFSLKLLPSERHFQSLSLLKTLWDNSCHVFLRTESTLITANQVWLEPTLGNSLWWKSVASSPLDFILVINWFFLECLLSNSFSILALTLSQIAIYLFNKSSSSIKKYNTLCDHHNFLQTRSFLEALYSMAWFYNRHTSNQ